MHIYHITLGDGLRIIISASSTASAYRKAVSCVLRFCPDALEHLESASIDDLGWPTVRARIRD